MQSRNIEKAERYIIKNLDKPLSLGEVSREIGMSKYHFARTFKAVTGKTFKTYHNQLRIERAKGLLQNNDLRITEVCYEVGFNDISYFDRMFHRLERISPSAYKKGVHTRIEQESPSF